MNSIPDNSDQIPLDSETIIANARRAVCHALERKLRAVIYEHGTRHSMSSYELRGVIAEVDNHFLVNRLAANGVIVKTPPANDPNAG